MSLSSALHNAMSGLVAARRASGVVSDNIANAMTPGYVRRSLAVTSNADAGSGVRVVGVVRHADPVAIANRRAADARLGAAEAEAGFASRVETLIGTPDDPASLPMRVAALESSLIEAASRPDSQQRLDTVARRAGDLVTAINAAAEGIRELRDSADAEIGRQVDRLNTALDRIRRLNARITAAQASGSDAAALMDQRQLLVDDVNRIVPVRLLNRPNGQIALYSEGGAILLDGTAARFEFTPTGTTAPQMTVDNGLLSGLKLNGREVRTSSAGQSPISGGTLAAQFRIRDELAVGAQADLDAFARDIVERFQAPGPDPTVVAGQPGLFTDAGAYFDGTAEIGLSQRLSLNAAADPVQGGQSWRLRAGLGAPDPGEPGDSRLLSALADALAAQRPLSSSRLGSSLMSAGAAGASLQSRVAGSSQLADETLAFAAATRAEMSRLELEQGVDTDAEMQTLLLIEQSYSANARIIQAVDDMMQTLLRI